MGETEGRVRSRSGSEGGMGIRARGISQWDWKVI